MVVGSGAWFGERTVKATATMKGVLGEIEAKSLLYFTAVI